MDERLVRLLDYGISVEPAVDYIAVELDGMTSSEWAETRPEDVTEGDIEEHVETVHATLTDAELATIEQPDSESSFPCDYCAESFQNKGALGSHIRHKHERNYADDDPALMTLNPDTRRFKVASAILYAPDAVLPREVETVLSGTEWEMDRVNISAELHDLHEHGAVARGKQEDESGQPYAYELTQGGEDRVNRAIKEARQEGLTTFEEI